MFFKFSHFHIHRMIAFSFLALALASCSSPINEKPPATVSTLTITHAKMALGIDAKLMPSGVTKTFLDGSKKVFCWFQWKDAQMPLNITARWTFLTDSLHILDYSFAVPRKNGFGGISLVMPEGKKLPLGQYQVDLISGEKVLQSIQFTVDLAPLSYFEITGSAQMTAGSVNSLQIKGFDPSGNLATGYNGPHVLTFSGAHDSPSGSMPQINGINLGNPVNVTFVDGVSEPSSVQFTAFKSENTTIYVSDGHPDTAGKGLPVSVAPGDIHQLEFTTQPLDSVAGEHLKPVVTILVKDAFGNQRTNDNNTPVSLSLKDAPEHATLSGTLTQRVQNGIARFEDLSINQAASNYSLLASSGTVSSKPSELFNISPAAAAYFSLKGSSEMTAGATNELTITAFDALDNLATSYQGEHELLFSGLSAAPNGLMPLIESTVLGVRRPVKFTKGVSTAATLTAVKSERTTVHVTDGSINSNDHSFPLTVTPSSLDNLNFLQGPSNATVKKIIVPSIKIQLRDAFNNVLTQDNTTTVSLVLDNTPKTATLLGTTLQRAIGGLVIFDDLSINKAGQGYTLVASPDSLEPETSAPFNIIQK